MTTTFEFKNYSITTSLNERNIYIKCIDTINFTNYEGNLEPLDIRHQKIYFSLDEVYKSIKYSLMNQCDFKIEIIIDVSKILILFDGLIGGIIKFNLKCELSEKIMISNNEHKELITYLMTEKLRHEETIAKQNEEIIFLKKSFDELTSINQNYKNKIILEENNIYIIGFRDGTSYDINTDEIVLLASNCFADCYKIKLFKNLKKLTISGCGYYSQYIENNNVKILNLYTYMGPYNIKFIDFIDKLPNLNKLALFIENEDVCDMLIIFISKSTQLSLLSEITIIYVESTLNNIRKRYLNFIQIIRTYCIKYEIKLIEINNDGSNTQPPFILSLY